MVGTGVMRALIARVRRMLADVGGRSSLTAVLEEFASARGWR
jgi:hypothetical protein